MKISNILKRVNSLGKNHIFDKNSHKITCIRDPIASILGARTVYLSDFIVAKIKGFVPGLTGHREVTDSLFKRIPKTLNHPYKIFRDFREPNRDKKIFVELDPVHKIVVELRIENRRAEINTIIPASSATIKKLKPERGYELLYSRPEGTVTPLSSLSQQDLSGVRTNTNNIAEK